MKSKAEQSIRTISKIKYRMILHGMIIGAPAGLLVSMFRAILSKAEGFRGATLRGAAADNETLILVLLGLLVCFFVTRICLKIEPLCAGSGIPQVMGELKGKIFQNWWKVIVTKFVGATSAICAGLSLGREGPSIQLGAMVGKGFAQMTGKLATEEKLLMSCGAAAGLSSAFGAPLAGVIFTLEELHNNFSTDLLLGAMAASMSANFVAYYIFGLDPVFAVSLHESLPLQHYGSLFLLGIFLGIFGVIYVKTVDFSQNIYGKLSNKTVRLAIPFFLAVVFAVYYPSVLGGGYELVSQAANGKFALGALGVLVILKFGFSIFSFGAGAPGGIFMPLLVIGGLSGGLFFSAFHNIMGIEEAFAANFVIYGMVGYFAAIVRSPVTGIILITEMVGDFRNFLSLSIVAFTAYVAADLMGSLPIYEQLLKRILSTGQDYGMDENLCTNKVLIYSDVYISSFMDGEKIESMNLPAGALVVAVNRGKKEIVPRGKTVLKGGDKLTVLCNQGDMAEVDDILKAICRS